jgi:transcription antitermination factor NusG
MPKNWHVIYTKPRNEKKVAARLIDSGYDIYCPLVKTLRQWSDRKKKVQVPMFPSYVFVRVDEKERQGVLQDPGVLNYVFWLGKPAIVRDKEMEAVRQIAEKGEEITVESGRLEKGQFVEIPEGPFKGLTGTVDAVDNRKVIVFIEQLDCKVQFRYQTS